EVVPLNPIQIGPGGFVALVQDERPLLPLPFEEFHGLMTADRPEPAPEGAPRIVGEGLHPIRHGDPGFLADLIGRIAIEVEAGAAAAQEGVVALLERDPGAMVAPIADGL